MGENFLDRLTRPATPDRPYAAPVVNPGAGTTAYAAAALRGEVENIAAVPIGYGRNDQLNRSAVKMYGLAAAGQIDERTVTETLGAADGGLDYPATRRTLQSARDAVFGRLGARTVPEPTAPSRPAATDPEGIPPWERSDDPLDENYVAPAGDAAGTDTTTGSSSAAAGPATTGSPSGSSAGDANVSSPGPGTATSEAQAAYDQLVAVEAGRIRLNRDARRKIDAEDALKTFRVPVYLPTLADELTIPDEPVTYRIDKLLPTGGNVLLAAQFKAGKTSLMNNLARSLADRAPFLDQYDIDALAGRVVIFNYEVDRAQYRRWLRDVGIVNADRVAVLPLRGFRLPLLVPQIEDWTVEYLKSVEAEVWIVDPFARAASGSVANENDNTEVGVFLEALDVIKERAGVSELILPTHTGRAEHEQGDERARGATRLDDWADVRWLLTKDKAGTRYFRATGRDVDTDEAALAFDESTRRLTITGGDRQTVERERYRQAVLTIVGNHPGHGKRDLRDAVRSIIVRASNDRIDDAVAALIESGQIHTRKAGHTLGHWPGRGTGAGEVDPLAA